MIKSSFQTNDEESDMTNLPVNYRCRFKAGQTRQENHFKTETRSNVKKVTNWHVFRKNKRFERKLETEGKKYQDFELNSPIFTA